jgi:formylglycine-generating enzyme required for sulfatase activity
MFELIDENAYYARPIPLRNPIVFYEGHLPAFAINTLVKKALAWPGVDARLEEIFARGIDPETEATAVARGNPAWPSRRDVLAYAADADRLIEDAIMTADLEREGDPLLHDAEALWTILEHEDMHQETLAYMWHQLPYALKRKPDIYVTAPPRMKASLPPRRVRVPSGTATLGTSPAEFGWDNERRQHSVEVDAFEVDAHNVTNAQFLEFVEATGAPPPAFWESEGGCWFVRGMFERVRLPESWPVYVTWAEADAYSRWRGGRLMSEPEYHRAAAGARPGNCDFQRWDPEPVGCRADTVSGSGVHDLIGNGWEWTATVFAPFAGFRPMPSYPEYSVDFFDGEHYVLKGASPVTPRSLLRPGFRNWFRPRYPYVYATFRVARDG